MKNYIILVIALLIYNLSIAQIVDIPDANFKFILVNLPVVDTNGDGFGDSDVDTNNDGEIQVTEAENTEWLIIGGLSVVSIEGIQSFVNLEYLQLGSLGITTIDLSQNILLKILKCGAQPLTSLDLSNNINLLNLNINFTEITSLDLSQNTQLETLDCGYTSVVNINLNNNINLKELNAYNTLISEIDLSNNINLEQVLLNDNLLTSLDVSNNINLYWIDVSNNQISTINLSQNINLEQIDFKNNQLTSLDISNNPDIFRINCENNQLTSLNLKNGNTNGITRLIAFGNPDLSCIQVDDVVYANNQICDGGNDGNWCKDDTAIYSENCILGITEQSLQEAVQLYPNPVKDVLQINTENNVVVKSVRVYDVMGKQLLKTKNVNQIDVSGFASGLLFVKIETNQGALIKKIIKE